MPTVGPGPGLMEPTASRQRTAQLYNVKHSLIAFLSYIGRIAIHKQQLFFRR